MYEQAPGSTSVSLDFLLRSEADAQAIGGLTYNSSGARATYRRKGGSPISFELHVLAGPTAPWLDGGFVEIDPGQSPPVGTYRVDVPDAAFAAGVPYVTVVLQFSNVLVEGALVLLRNPTNNVGPGSIPWTITVENANNSQPLAGAQVWVSTDSAGANVIAGTLTTNTAGQVVFMLDPGSYYLWCSDPGFHGTNPTSFTVS